jgi:pyrroline-5-carboxylate reductase
LVFAARRPEHAEAVAARTGVPVVLDAAVAASGRRIVVVAVKPGDVPRLLQHLQGAVDPSQMILSIAAGVTTAAYERALGDLPVVRAMPNTPALIDQGVSALCSGAFADDEAMALAERVLAAVGETVRLDEHLLDAVTAVSGTGPAYVFLLAEALTEAAIREGLPRHAAEKLVNQTVKGAGMLMSAVDTGPEQLRAQVTSPGGTTAAAVHVLEERGFRALVEDAVRAAARRSRELGERVTPPEA